MANIEVKGGRDGLVLVLPETGTQGQLLASLYHYLSTKGDFFKGAEIWVEIGQRRMAEGEVAQLRELLSQWDVTLLALRTADQPRPAPALDDFGGGNGVGEGGTPLATVSAESSDALTVRRTLRGGQIIRHPGSVTVIGDVNPGAEIVAGGDVVVWGVLRGVVHAGAMGDDDAIVCALKLEPTQLRISAQIAISPEEPKAKRGRLWQRIGPRAPECAFLQEGRIVVEKWSGK